MLQQMISLWQQQCNSWSTDSISMCECDVHNTVCDQVQSVYSQPILIVVLGPIGWSRLTPLPPYHNLPSVSRPLSRFGGPARLTILNPPHTLHYLLRLIIFISTHTQTRRQCVRSPGTDGIMPRYPPRILSTYGPARMTHLSPM